MTKQDLSDKIDDIRSRVRVVPDMWHEYTPSDPQFNEFADYIDGFDYEHNIWVHLHENEDGYVLVYRNEGVEEGEGHYWGIYTTDGDGDFHSVLETAKKWALEMMPDY